MTPHDLALPPKYSYNLVHPNLSMGGAMTDYSEAFDDFDIIVFCAGEWQPYVCLPEDDKEKRVIRVPYDDSHSALTPSVLKSLHKAADELAIEHEKGKRILISCLAGRNRSGLLTALVLMRLGLSGDLAISTIKEMRGAFALTNTAFTSYLRSLRTT